MNHQADHWDHCLEYACLTNIGMRRTNNQDALAAVVAPTRQQWMDRGHLFMVADGMGAHAAGELASKLAVDTVPLTYDKLRELSPPVAIHRAITAANDKIHSRGEANPEFKGMGTTTSVLLLLPQGAVVGHVGDSRVYRLRGNRLEQLSFDHSLVWELRASRKAGDPELQQMVPKNIITRSLGPNAEVNIDLEGPFPLATGDVYLVCSDGLSGPVEDEEIGVILGSLPAEEAARVLVDLANLRGGPDNITVCVARVKGSQITQVAAPPLSVDGKVATLPNQTSTTPILWAVAGVFLLAAAVLATLAQPFAAAASLAAALVTAAFVLLRQSGAENGLSVGNSSLLGTGPYTTRVCAANKKFVDRLEETVHRLRDAARGQDWAVDWHRFKQLCESGAKSAGEGQFTDAVQHYYRAIQHMMAELRGQRQRGESEPAADLDEPRN
jgi:protein phosphatase